MGNVEFVEQMFLNHLTSSYGMKFETRKDGNALCELYDELRAKSGIYFENVGYINQYLRLVENWCNEIEKMEWGDRRPFIDLGLKYLVLAEKELNSIKF